MLYSPEDQKAVKHTCFLIGGKNAERAEEVFEAVKDSMFPPFKTSIIVDPAGAYTTAAAMVAKAENALEASKLGELKTKTCRYPWHRCSRTNSCCSLG